MSTSIHIDISQYGLSPADILAPQISGAIASSITATLAVVRDKWQQEAQAKLNSTRAEYLMGLDFNSLIYPFAGNPFSGAVQLKGTLPNMIESGYS